MEKGVEKQRFEYIDIFRGLTMFLMIIISNPGNPANIPAFLKHADWNGATMCDFIFPFFVFIMGVVVPISLKSKLEKKISRAKIIASVLRRSILLFLFGLLLNGFPTYDLTVIRIPGVLQRIAIVYFCTALLYILLKSVIKKDLIQIAIQSLIAIALLFVYYYIIKHIQAPGYDNLVTYVDVTFLKGHLYTPTFDPEGILSTIPAIGSGLIGAVIGMFLQRKDSHLVKMVILVGSGILFIICAELFNIIFPYNKQLWSSSFVLLTSGAAILLLAALYLMTDILKIGKVFTPFKAIGSSAIFVYFISGLIGITVSRILPTNYFISITTTYITPWAHNLDTIVFSVGYATIWILIMGILYRQKIYIRL